MKKNSLRLFLLGVLGLSTLGCWYNLVLRLLQFSSGTYAETDDICLLAAAVLLSISFVALRQGFFQQMDDLEDVVNHWDSTRPEDLRACIQSLSGPVGSLGGSLYSQMSRMEEKLANIRQETAKETEWALKAQFVREICRFALPNRLPEFPSRENFAIAGIVREGRKPVCVYYDSFYVDPGLLCVAVGQVPDHEVSGAMFMSNVQNGLRSCLQMGRSLANAMADVNSLVFDRGEKIPAAVIMGTLDTFTGRFTYVNAGGCNPMLMRSREDCQWEETPVFDALGRNQRVTYRTSQLRLQQGDRLFLCTAGLMEARGRDGQSFGEKELRPALNRTRDQGEELEDGLRHLADAADAYCVEGAESPGYAALMLEFRKKDKELTNCRVPASPESSQTVMEFLKRRFEENGIKRRSYAPVAVLGEELFSLCCKKAKAGSVLTVECGVAPDGEAVTLRVSGLFGGMDPLQQESSFAAQSADYIREQADLTQFQAGEGENSDTVTVIFFFSP